MDIKQIAKQAAKIAAINAYNSVIKLATIQPQSNAAEAIRQVLIANNIHLGFSGKLEDKTNPAIPLAPTVIYLTLPEQTAWKAQSIKSKLLAAAKNYGATVYVNNKKLV